MSRFFPHTAFEEDQPLAHTILATHVLTRGAQTGALVSLAIMPVRAGISALRSGPKPPAAAAAAAAGPFPTSPPISAAASASSAASVLRAPLTTRLLRSTGTGTAIGFGLLTIGLGARMWGRDTIEWQDRAWRLLENQGQVETDDWTFAGMGAGLVGASALALSQLRAQGPAAEVARIGWRGVIGGAGLGSVLGMIGYMGWRYGLHKGQFPEKIRDRDLT
jgi:hypothetical protein